MPYKPEKTVNETQAARDWAVKTGIIKGYGDGNFGWDQPVTREQLATILYRLEGK